MNKMPYWTVVFMFAGTALLLHSRSRADIIPASEPLSRIPAVIAGWSGSDVPIDQDSLSILGPGQFISRIYSADAQAEPIGLFIGYFPTQRTGVSIHSPKNCLPGSGWAFESSRYVGLIDARGTPHRVGEYLITNGEKQQFVIYWYQAHGRSIANEYVAKVHMVIDAVRMNRTDGALVRISTPVSPTESIPQARTRAESFTRQLAPMLSRFIPN